MEIDEYRDYEKALNALKRAGEYMTKARGDASREEKVQALKSRIMHIEQVSRAAAAFPFFFLLFFFSSSSICSSSDETNSHE
jgi:hypothetical protein